MAKLSVTLKGKKDSYKPTVSVKKKSEKENLGSLSVNSKQLPEVKEWSVGEEYEVIVRVRQTSAREADSWDIESGRLKDGDITAQFEILSIEPKEEEEDEEYEEDEE